jgi:hypothetical protein
MFDEPKFTMSQVAEAVAVSANTLRSWLQRNHWRLDTNKGDSPTEAAGKAHLLTLRRALHIGAAVELIKNNVEPARAFAAALSFVDIFDPTEDDDGHFRGPEGLFQTGWTLLIAYPDTPFGVVMRVENNPGAKNQSPLSKLLFPKMFSPRRGRSGTFVWLNQIDTQIRTALVPVEGR